MRRRLNFNALRIKGAVMRAFLTSLFTVGFALVPVAPAAGQSGFVSNSFTQSGAGVVARSLDEKARERVNVKDFRARGDGLADDTSAIVAAEACWQRLGLALFSTWHLFSFQLDAGQNRHCGRRRRPVCIGHQGHWHRRLDYYAKRADALLLEQPVD